MPLEIERKFLIKAPLNFKTMKSVWANATSVDKIVQYYLRSDKGVTRRLRVLCELGSNEYKYIHTVKKNIASGINEEDEHEISLNNFQELATSATLDMSKAAICKTRYTFDYDNQVFELDVFEESLEGLVLLEIELESMDVKVNLPPFLNVVKEVTEDERYRNSRLAKLVKNKKRKAIKALI